MKTTNPEKPDFPALLDRRRPVLIDGGLATQCEAMGCNIDGILWSGVLLRENPRALIGAHRTYLDAGAEIIASASYQASRRGFAATGLTQRQADDLIASSVALARQARDEFTQDKPALDYTPLVAASIGPYGAVLHDGSEYRGNYSISNAELARFHRERLEILDNCGADLLAVETVPSAAECGVLCELLRHTSSPAWISFSCRDEAHLADGTPVAAVAGLFRDHPKVMAVGANCMAPALTGPLIAQLRHAVPDKSILVYPNSGETYNANDKCWSGTATPFQCERAVLEWVEAGAQMVGGCCRVGPAQIAAMATALALS